jgi:hypothetical protein
MNDDKAAAAYHPGDAPVTRPELDALIGQAVQTERDRQVAMGYDEKHDDSHGFDHLAWWAHEYRSKGEFIKSLALWRAYDECTARRRAVIRADIQRQHREGGGPRV